MSNSFYTNWFEEFKKSGEYTAFTKAPIAYFSAEFALDSALPTYAGGLGVLAGDIAREAGAQDLPLVSVSLYYQRAQSVLSFEPYKNDLKIVKDKDGGEIVVTVPMEGRVVHVRAWLWQEGKANVYLLDTDIADNDPKDRGITKELYDEDRDIRLKQEIILGIGGFRLLASLGYHASVYHLNEGHSAFLALELIRHEMEHQKVDFAAACQFAKKHIIFTNHTLVPAGQEVFATEKVNQFIDPCAKEICLVSDEIAALGAIPENPKLFSMTTFSFRLSGMSSTVSEFHMKKSQEIWPGHIMENVTNGIFIPRWDQCAGGETGQIWAKHLESKKKLLALVKEKTGEVWRENDLIFVWARRLVEYKQPLFLLSDVTKLEEIVKNSKVPVRIIFSGPTGEHENDNPFISQIREIISDKLKGNIVFIPNYNLDIAKILTAGADVWLNTPMLGREACGTSGMKAALNGVLALSTNDGWVHEVTPEDIGWVLGDTNPEEILALIESKIIPLYEKHLASPANSIWQNKMMRARGLVLERFSTSRTLKEYIEKLYIPTLRQKHEHTID